MSDSKPTRTFWRPDLGDHGWMIELALTGDHWIDWRAWRASYTDVDGPRFGGPWVHSISPDHRGFDPHVTGFVKWDGCAQVRLADGYLHTCGRIDLADTMTVPLAAWDLAMAWFAELGTNDCEPGEHATKGERK